MAKRLVFCFDGTWNRLSADNPTNVVLIAQMVRPVAHDGMPQLVYYDEGIGTSSGFFKRLWQGISGRGMEKILREAYRFLLFNHEPGDEIFIFGFSRGAFTARSFAGFIRHAGILDVASATKIDDALRIYKAAPAGETGKESEEAKEFRVENCKAVCVSEADLYHRIKVDPSFDPKTPLLDIKYLGVWDTVSALGVPKVVPFSKHLNTRYRFHDAVLTSKIKAARHAVALDEKRVSFPATLFGRSKLDELNAAAQNKKGKSFEDWKLPYQQQWFPGVHGAVGGGGKSRGLSDAALHWVLSGARRQGLQVRNSSVSVVFEIAPDALSPVFNDPPGHVKRAQAAIHAAILAKRGGPKYRDEIAHVTFQRWHKTRKPNVAKYNPRSLRNVVVEMDSWEYSSPPEWKGQAGQGAPPLEEFQTDGHSLSALSADRLKDPKRWPELFALNRDRIDDPDYLPSGVKLRVPKK